MASSGAHFSGISNEVHMSYATVDVPDCLKSNTSPQGIRANNRHFQLATSSASSQSSGGILLWNIPPAKVAICRQSMYLRMRVTVTTAAAPTYADAATSLSFQGQGDLNGSFMPILGNAYSVIQRLTLYGTSSAVISQMNYVNDVQNLFIGHNSNLNWISTDGLVQVGTGRPWTVISATSSFIDVCIPLPLSCFQNSDQNFPLYLANSPLTLQLDLASLARGIFSGATTAATEYTVSNAYLCYNVVELPHQLMEAERQAIKSSPFVMPLSDYLNIQIPVSNLTSYTMGLNASSIRAVFLLPLKGTGYDKAVQLKYWRDTSDNPGGTLGGNNGASVNAQLYFDGNIKNSSIYDTAIMTFTQLKQALHHNINQAVIQSSVLQNYSTNNALFISNYGNYLASNYAVGWDCTSFDDNLLMCGTPATNLNIQLTGYGNTQPTYLVTVIVIYDSLLIFKDDGQMEIKR
jgi:hypothetical protein